MRYLAILLLVLAGCAKSSPRLDPKFKYGQEVSITKGFYEGRGGVVSQWRYCQVEDVDGDLHRSICYEVQSTNSIILTVFKDVPEGNLEATK